MRKSAAVLALGYAMSMAGRADAATLPTGFIETEVASGMAAPTAMDFAPDGRLFVCEKGGALRVIKNGALLATPFVELTVNSAWERGLLGVAFDPNFIVNQWVYVYYTATTPTIHNRISRFTAAGDVAQVDSEVVILDLDNLSSAANHNGGAIHFGPDGKLYAAVGENAHSANSQTLANLLGKMLRLNNDGTIPTDNPFYNQASGKNRMIWAMGVRNPFTFAFQRGTGRMFINDVGGGAWEEIDDGIAGSNYGWPSAEGNVQCSTYRCPLYSYDHSSGRAITGGAFYNPETQQFPSSYLGKYFFADYVFGWIRTFDPATSGTASFASGISGPVDLHVGPDGLLYYLAIGGGAVHKIAAQPSIVSVGAVTGNSAVLHGSAWDTHAASQWQVDLLGGDFSGPVVDSGRTTSALTSFRANGLAATTTYQSRVRYQDLSGAWSPWSDPALDPNDQFTTLVATAIAPIVVAVVPADKATGVAVTVSPVLSFNVPVAAPSVTPATVKLVRKGAPATSVTAALTLDVTGQLVTIAPAGLLDPNCKYKIQVVRGDTCIESRDGAIPGKDFSAVFFTERALASSSPMSGATGVALAVTPQLDFKWMIDSATATTRTIKLKDATSGRSVPLASVIVSGVTVTVTPAAPLKAKHKHVLSVAPGPSGLRFTDGRQIEARITVVFKTGS